MSEAQYRKVRIYFRKVGDVKFLSHLDVMRTMDRALRRTGPPIRFTEGMNPKVKMNFPTARNPTPTTKPVRMESRTTRCRLAPFIPSVREMKRGMTPIASMATKMGMMASNEALISQGIVMIRRP